MDSKHQKMIDRLPKLFEDVNCPGKFKNGECDEKNTELFVNASREHPFRMNNIREASGKLSDLLQRSLNIVRTPTYSICSIDTDCYEVLRSSGAMVAAVAS